MTFFNAFSRAFIPRICFSLLIPLSSLALTIPEQNPEANGVHLMELERVFVLKFFGNLYVGLR